MTLRTLSILIAVVAIFALSLTGTSGTTRETLPNVPTTDVVVSNPEATEGEVVEMREWRSTSLANPPAPTKKKR